MPGERTREIANCLANAGKRRGMPGERKVVGAKCQGNVENAGECQGNVSECKVPGECRGMTGESTGVGVKC